MFEEEEPATSPIHIFNVILCGVLILKCTSKMKCLHEEQSFF